MKQMMDGGMMWGMGLGGLIVLILVVLAIVALVKYIFFQSGATELGRVLPNAFRLRVSAAPGFSRFAKVFGGFSRHCTPTTDLYLV
jgi:hypothetical protein